MLVIWCLDPALVLRIDILVLSLSTVFLQPVELVTTCTLTMLGALEVVRAAYCDL